MGLPILHLSRRLQETLPSSTGKLNRAFQYSLLYKVQYSLPFYKVQLSSAFLHPFQTQTTGGHSTPLFFSIVYFGTLLEPELGPFPLSPHPLPNGHQCMLASIPNSNNSGKDEDEDDNSDNNNNDNDNI